MILSVIGNSGSNHDRCTGNKRDQDLIDIVYVVQDKLNKTTNLITERIRL